ncbi:hypothetical protein E4U52_003603 [Claviceps spartinae]|nr:hypothetical protein E4U52_003603 [Claviceps spartinae]
MTVMLHPIILSVGENEDQVHEGNVLSASTLEGQTIHSYPVGAATEPKKHMAYSKNKDDDTKAQDALAKCKRYEFLFKCSSEAFEKAEKYYNHCDKAAAYYLAIVLDPRDKMNWFHQPWDKYPTTKATWIPGVRRQVLEVWDDEYYQAPSAAPPTRSGDSDEPSPCKISSSSKYARFFTNRHVVSGQAPQAVDHFRQYLDEDPIAAEKDFDVIDYWMKRREASLLHLKRNSYRLHLARASWAFVSKIDIIEACECLRQWLGVAEKDESDLLKAEEEALQGYQHINILGNNQEHGGILDGPEFDQKIEDDE